MAWGLGRRRGAAGRGHGLGADCAVTQILTAQCSPAASPSSWTPSREQGVRYYLALGGEGEGERKEGTATTMRNVAPFLRFSSDSRGAPKRTGPVSTYQTAE